MQGLRPEFEGISSQLQNREDSLSCDEVASQLLSEESHLQEMEEEIAQPMQSPVWEDLDLTKMLHLVPAIQIRPQLKIKTTYGAIIVNEKGHRKETCWKHMAEPHRYMWSLSHTCSMVTQPQVQISYGTLVVVAGIGSVNIVPQRILTHVLHS